MCLKCLNEQVILLLDLLKKDGPHWEDDLCDNLKHIILSIFTTISKNWMSKPFLKPLWHGSKMAGHSLYGGDLSVTNALKSLFSTVMTGHYALVVRPSSVDIQQLLWLSKGRLHLLFPFLEMLSSPRPNAYTRVADNFWSHLSRLIATCRSEKNYVQC